MKSGEEARNEGAMRFFRFGLFCLLNLAVDSQCAAGAAMVEVQAPLEIQADYSRPNPRLIVDGIYHRSGTPPGYGDPAFQIGGRIFIKFDQYNTPNDGDSYDLRIQRQQTGGTYSDLMTVKVTYSQSTGCYSFTKTLFTQLYGTAQFFTSSCGPNFPLDPAIYPPGTYAGFFVVQLTFFLQAQCLGPGVYRITGPGGPYGFKPQDFPSEIKTSYISTYQIVPYVPYFIDEGSPTESESPQVNPGVLQFGFDTGDKISKIFVGTGLPDSVGCGFRNNLNTHAEVTVVPESGGHLHFGPAEPPTGQFISPSSNNTGNLAVLYQAGAYGMEETIRGYAYDPVQGLELTTDGFPVNISIPNLEPLDDTNLTYRLQGDGTICDQSHNPSDTVRYSNYVMPAMKIAIQDMAAKFYSSEQTQLVLNDASLPRGGVIDNGTNNRSAKPCHKTHRLGIDIDVKRNGYPSCGISPALKCPSTNPIYAGLTREQVLDRIAKDLGGYKMKEVPLHYRFKDTLNLVPQTGG